MANQHHKGSSWIMAAALLGLVPSYAVGASAAAKASAQLVSPAQVATIQATQVLFSTSTGVLSLNLPGSSGLVVLELPVAEPAELFFCLGGEQTNLVDGISCVWSSNSLTGDTVSQPAVGATTSPTLSLLNPLMDGIRMVSLTLVGGGSSPLLITVAYN
jgi:hypothetical protein